MDDSLELINESLSEELVSDDYIMERLRRRTKVLSILRRLLKPAYWRIRQTLRLTPSGEPETLYRLRNQAPTRSKLFPFSWGRLKYANIGQLAAQYEEIFVQRQYAFTPKRPAPVIIDCGGNIGVSAIWFKLNYPSCNLVVYEADPDLASVIRQNLREARLYDVAVRNEAVWIDSGSVSFEKSGDDSGRIVANGGSHVASVDISAELPDQVDLLKLDIEGAEYPVLQKLCETGAIQQVDCLVCEFHVYRDRIDDLLKTLTLLRKSGLQLSMTSAAVPWIGLADEAPFKVIARNQILMEVFAWRSE